MTDRTPDEHWRHVFVTGLQNAHGVEQQAMSLLSRQIERYEMYPEVTERLAAHRVETEEQIRRLDALLGGFDEGRNGLKDLALKLSGNMAAIAHSFAEDEILKNAFANAAFETFEASSYKSLITLAEIGGYSQALDPLRQTLEEELAMVRWADESIPALTEKYLRLKQQGENATR